MEERGCVGGMGGRVCGWERGRTDNQGRVKSREKEVVAYKKDTPRSFCGNKGQMDLF